MFKTIEKNVIVEIVEKKSKFIGNLYYVESIEEAEDLIKQVNKMYFDARHNCYAFRIMTENGSMERFSDDGEPSGTAGAPMLSALMAQNLCNILMIVTRYFGGILLGTGGLVKAYTETLQEALKKANMVQKELGKEFQILVSYADLEKLKYYLKQKNIYVEDVIYEENVAVIADMTKEKWQEIWEQRQNLNFKILDYKMIKEKFIIV